MSDLHSKRESGYYEEHESSAGDWYLSPKHRDLLRSAGISDEVIGGRRPLTLIAPEGDPDVARRTLRHGFGISVRNPEQLAGLMLPVYSADPQEFSPVRYMFRPDVPEVDEHGKAKKYLMPAGSESCLTSTRSPSARSGLSTRTCRCGSPKGSRRATP